MQNCFGTDRPRPAEVSSPGLRVRWDSAIEEGYRIPPHYDSMIAKLICRAQTREECIAKMERALEEFIVEGVKTTVPFHKKLMKDEKFKSGNFHTGFLNDFSMNDEE